MSLLRWRSCVIEAVDVAALARFWQGATGFARAVERPDEVVLTGDGQVDSYPGIVIVKVSTDSERVSSRVHLDLNSTDLATDLPRLLALGASLVADHGDEWKTLDDPEGNLFCVRQT